MASRCGSSQPISGTIRCTFHGYARGGASLASEAEYLDASLSASLVGISGVGGFSPVDLGKVLAGRIANASPYVSTYTHGISGGSTPRDLETALQLVYLHFTASNHDPEAFELMKRASGREPRQSGAESRCRVRR